MHSPRRTRPPTGRIVGVFGGSRFHSPRLKGSTYVPMVDLRSTTCTLLLPSAVGAPCTMAACWRETESCGTTRSACCPFRPITYAGLRERSSSCTASSPRISRMLTGWAGTTAHAGGCHRSEPGAGGGPRPLTTYCTARSPSVNASPSASSLGSIGLIGLPPTATPLADFKSKRYTAAPQWTSAACCLETVSSSTRICDMPGCRPRMKNLRPLSSCFWISSDPRRSSSSTFGRPGIVAQDGGAH